MKLLFLLLRRNVSLWQMLGFGLGGMVGALIVLVGVQAWRDVHRAFSADDNLFAANYVVVSKPVSFLTTLSGLIGAQSPAFTEREIADIEALADVAEVARFRSARFSVDGVVRVSGHTLGTEMFLESVPDAFVDLPQGDTAVWHAALNDDFVPVLVPRSYLDLYNFGYASSRGLPQLSEGAVGRFSFRLLMGGRSYRARIVSFSTRLNTILVPDGFLDAANEAFGRGEAAQPSRLIIRTKGREPGAALLEHIGRCNYVVADGNDALVRMRTFVYGIVWTVVAVGALVTLMAFILLVVSILLLVEKNRTVFRNLACMGYTVGEMSRPYRWLAVAVDVSVWTLAAAFATLIYVRVGRLVALAVPQMEAAALWPMLLVAVVGCAVFVGLHFWVIRRAVERTVGQ